MKDQCQTGKLHTIFGSTILWCYFEFYIPVFTFNLPKILCWDMARWEKCLSWKHEDLGSDFQSLEKSGMAGHFWSPSVLRGIRRWTQENP